MIRIDALWLCTQPHDMRAGPERLLAAVVNTVGGAQAYHGYLFANARGTRLKLLVSDGFGVWCAARRLHSGSFVRTSQTEADAMATLQLTAQQFEGNSPTPALVDMGSTQRSTRCWSKPKATRQV